MKKHLTWSDWLRAYLRNVAKWIVFMFLVVLVIRLIRGNFKSIADLFSIGAIGIGACMGTLLFVVSWLASFRHVEIQVCEKNIVVIQGVGASAIPYKKVQKCTVREVELEGQKLEILEIQYLNGNESIFEIDPAMPGDTVIEMLRQRGLQVSRA